MRCLGKVVLLLVAPFLVVPVSSWLPSRAPSNSRRRSTLEPPTSSRKVTVLGYKNDQSEEEEPPQKEEQQAQLERLTMSGVSVSKLGFTVLFQSRLGVLPLQVTKDPQDETAATSPEALTILQLLSGVDMAGAILPPETLAKLVVLYCEQQLQPLLLEEENDNVAAQVRRSLQSSIQTVCQTHKIRSLPSTFTEAHAWIQAKIPLPHVTLDQVTLEYVDAHWQCRLDCHVDGRALSVPLTCADWIEDCCFTYHPHVSHIFLSVALALRYRAPIVLQQQQSAAESVLPALAQDLNQHYGQRTTVAKLQAQSNRISHNLERGFEIHKLQGALQMAQRLGDDQAAARIRAKLDELDSLQGLPTIGSETKDESTTGVSKASSVVLPVSRSANATTDGGDPPLDDLEHNILQ